MNKEVKLLEIAKNFIGADGNITLDTPREEAEGWDSLVHVMLISAAAEDLGIKVPIEDSENIKCLRDILKYEK